MLLCRLENTDYDHVINDLKAFIPDDYQLTLLTQDTLVTLVDEKF